VQSGSNPESSSRRPSDQPPDNNALDLTVADGRPSGPPSGACRSTRIRYPDREMGALRIGLASLTGARSGAGESSVLIRSWLLSHSRPAPSPRSAHPPGPDLGAATPIHARARCRSRSSYRRLSHCSSDLTPARASRTVMLVSASQPRACRARAETWFPQCLFRSDVLLSPPESGACTSSLVFFLSPSHSAGKSSLFFWLASPTSAGTAECRAASIPSRARVAPQTNPRITTRWT